MKRTLDDDLAHALDAEFCRTTGLDDPDPLEDREALEKRIEESINSPEDLKRLRAMISVIDVEVQRLWALKACFYAIEAKLTGRC